MTKLLHSSIPPLKKGAILDLYKVLEKELGNATTIRIASGFISTEALSELSRAVEINNNPYVEVIIGMHKFDGFTRPQYQAALNLDNLLRAKGLGGVWLADIFRFHGKLYSFSKGGNLYAASVGSSNFSGLGQHQRNFEVDVFLEDEATIKQVDELIGELKNRASRPLKDIDENSLTFIVQPPPLENVDSVEQCSRETITDIQVKARLKNIYFELPLKDEPKSNLNVFFGKGRKNKAGFVIPRHWYEVELIVSNTITRRKGYPRPIKGKENIIKVYTDDGWSFECKVSGDYSKNFRSSDDLRILGRWIKGRLENAGVLEPGKLVTENILEKYGRDTVTLMATDDSKIWYLDFSVRA
jgi:HKD family nuclease